MFEIHKAEDKMAAAFVVLYLVYKFAGWFVLVAA